MNLLPLSRDSVATQEAQQFDANKEKHCRKEADPAATHNSVSTSAQYPESELG
jgi:hypothetical protein